MNVPLMYYVGLISNLVFLFLTAYGFFYINQRNGVRYPFLIYFALAWLCSGLSYVLLISGVATDDGYVTALRIVSYVFFLGTILSMIFVLLRSGKDR